MALNKHIGGSIGEFTKHKKEEDWDLVEAGIYGWRVVTPIWDSRFTRLFSCPLPLQCPSAHVYHVPLYFSGSESRQLWRPSYQRWFLGQK